MNELTKFISRPLYCILALHETQVEIQKNDLRLHLIQRGIPSNGLVCEPKLVSQQCEQWGKDSAFQLLSLLVNSEDRHRRSNLIPVFPQGSYEQIVGCQLRHAQVIVEFWEEILEFSLVFVRNVVKERIPGCCSQIIGLRE